MPVLIGNALENSFAAHVEIFHKHLCRFAIRADGKATQVTVENLNVHGEGSFKRIPDQK